MRTGGFVRSSSSTNLTSQLEQLYAAEQSATWSAVNDAWKNGGTYDFDDGKGPVPVTDERILRYMTMRRDQIADKTDPNWAQWDNNVQQQTFNIDASKIGLDFKQGKVSASQVAAFYQNWMTKLDPNSEFYRTVAGQAADWAKYVTDSARAGAGSSVEKALKARQQANDAVRYEFSIMESDLTQAAQAAQLIGPGQTIGAIADTARWQQMLEDGITVNGRTYDMSDWANGQQRVYAAWTDDIAIDKQKGDYSAATSDTRKRSDFASTYIAPTNGMSLESRYLYLRDTYDADLDAAQHDPAAVKRAQDRYVAGLQGLLKDVSAAGTDTTKGGVSPEFAQGLQNDINAQMGSDTGPTWEDYRNSTGRDSVTTQDSTQQVKNATGYAAERQAWESGDLVYGQQYPGGPMGLFTPQDIGIKFDSQTNLPTKDPAVQATRSADGTVTYYNGKAVYALNSDGSPKTVLGYIFSDANGKAVQYGVVQPDGKTMLYSTDNPFNGLSQTTYNGVNYVSSNATPKRIATTPEGSLGVNSVFGNTSFITADLGGGISDKNPLGDRQKAVDWANGIRPQDQTPQAPTYGLDRSGQTPEGGSLGVPSGPPRDQSNALGTMSLGIGPAPIKTNFGDVGANDHNPLGDRQKALDWGKGAGALPTPTIQLPNLPATGPEAAAEWVKKFAPPPVPQAPLADSSTGSGMGSVAPKTNKQTTQGSTRGYV